MNPANLFLIGLTRCAVNRKKTEVLLRRTSISCTGMRGDMRKKPTAVANIQFALGRTSIRKKKIFQRSGELQLDYLQKFYRAVGKYPAYADRPCFRDLNGDSGKNDLGRAFLHIHHHGSIAFDLH